MKRFRIRYGTDKIQTQALKQRNNPKHMHRSLWRKVTNSSRRVLLLCMAVWLTISQVVVIEPVSAISTRAAAAGVQNGGSTLTISVPAGTVQDDVMVATVALRTGLTITSITPPAGWTAQVVTNNATKMILGTYTKVASGSEPASYQWSWSGTLKATGGITAYQGVNTSSPVEAVGTGSTGLGSPITANSVTTLSNVAYVVGSYTVQTFSTFTPPAGMTEQIDTTTTGGSDIAASQVSVQQPIAGASGTKTITASAPTDYSAHLIALKPGVPDLEQSSYRFSVNADNNVPNYILDDLSGGDDNLRGSTVDKISSVFYAVGDNGSNWIIEKRRVADGSLCTATNCGTTFGTNGRITQDIAGSAIEKAYDVAVDPSLGFIYVVGMDSIGAGQWHVEKRNMLTGALINGFGTGGIVTSNPSNGADEALTIKLDGVSGYIYVGGYDGTGNNQWKLDKYRTDNGALCSAANCGTSFGTNGTYINNISNGDDRISNLELDPTNTYLYISGFDAKNTRTQWTTYKIRADSAAPCTAAACGTQFGVNGLYNSDPTTRDDKVLTLQVDSAAGAIYLGGYESPTTSTSRWRIEKIDLDTGAPITSFGNNGSCASANVAAICAQFSSGDDKIANMALDGAGGFIYMIGGINEAGTDSEWRVQKRNRSDGSLVSGWATGGTASFNPSSNKDPATSIVLDTDRGVLYALGGDRSLGTTNMRWRFEELALDTGTMWLAPANTLGGISSTVTFRLRLLLHVTNNNLMTSDNLQYKLQYSPKVGTCDTGFVGESYGDIATSGGNDILYHTNPSVADGTTAIAKPGEDPTHGSDTVVVQTIEQANNFTNSTANVLNGQDGLWDFVLKDNGAFGAYCFRAVDSSGTPLASYTQIPELTFCKDDPKTNALLRNGTYFCEGVKKSFFWAL